jgi:hypothetical protein
MTRKSRGFAWICLLVTVSTMAYGVQLTAARMLPPAAVDVGEQRARLPAGAATLAHELLITGLDDTTGDRMRVVCVTTSDRVAIAALVVQLKNLGNVAAQLCDGSNAREPGAGSF